jgi:predicted amidohydrolase YtcJ
VVELAGTSEARNEIKHRSEKVNHSKPYLHLIIVSLIILVISSALLPGQHTEPVAKADIVLLNGKVVTVDKDFSIKQAVAVKGERIIFTGSNDEVKKFITTHTEIFQLNGALVLPGLIDAHAHLQSLGDQLSNLDIKGTTSFKEITAGVAKKVKTKAPGEWIIGGRWDQNDWTEKTFPHHRELSNISPNNPVYLRRVDGNSCLVNQKAMDIAGITADTPNPFGGKIHKDNQGKPTGVLINQAMNLVKKHIPQDTPQQQEKKFKMAIQSCLSVGLTGVHEAGVRPREIALFKQLIDKDELNFRIYAMLGDQENPTMKGDLVAYLRKHRVENYGNHFLSVRSIKIYFDGALGSRGAAFFTPYDDDPKNNGLLRVTPEYITKISKAALQAGMGVNTHCIGIRGNRLCLDAYEKALKAFPVKDHRFRIEHAQVVRKKDVEKYKTLGVIPAMQPTHCTSDMGFVEARIGHKRAQGAYAWRWFLDEKLIIPMGSDFPVESNNPLYGIYAVITRQDHNGQPPGGWFPQHKVTIQEAIRGFTIWAAYGAFQEDVLGSIEKGKLADFTILDKDITKIKPAEILKTKVLYTIIAGKIRYQGAFLKSRPLNPRKTSN